MTEKNTTGRFYNPSYTPTLKQERLFQAQDDAYKIENPFLWPALRELALQQIKGKLSKLRVGNHNPDNLGYAYLDSTTQEKKCVAYLDFQDYTLVRLGDEVTIPGQNKAGRVEKIQYNQDEDAIHCVVGFKEKDVEMIVPPGLISKNCTLELGNRD